MTRPENLRGRTRISTFVVQRTLAATQRALPSLTAALPAFTQADGGKRSGAFVDALAYSRTQPVTPFFRPMDFAINRHLGRLLRADGVLTADQCLANLAADPDIAKHFEMPATPVGDP
ncbi:MAG: hypothetical protein GY778_30265 [bacterium]|nr:hypothetical protein [bacterium]